MIEIEEKISGLSLKPNNFQLVETTGTIDVDLVYEVIKGNLTAYRIKNYMSNEVCNKIVTNFWSSPEKKSRMGYGQDGVEGYFIGASHIEKTTAQYLEEATNFEKAVKELYKDTQDPVSSLREMLSLNKNIKVRPAEHEGSFAGHSKAVSWNNFGHFLLEPHDDFAQTRDPLQQGFEIQKVSNVTAANFYPKVTQDSGQLKLWNIQPDDESRKRLGLTYSGFPYPSELLNDFDSLVIPVQTGDLCIINGKLIHAVVRGNSNSAQDRLLISFFMAFDEPSSELIWWT